jgi:hypothetical protein
MADRADVQRNSARMKGIGQRAGREGFRHDVREMRQGADELEVTPVEFAGGDEEGAPLRPFQHHALDPAGIRHHVARPIEGQAAGSDERDVGVEPVEKGAGVGTIDATLVFFCGASA